MMSLGALSLRDLEYLVALARYRHFRRAAEACRVSQPALSAQVRKIEDLLGTTLFERTNRKVSVTESGETIVAQAQRVLEEAEKILLLAQAPTAPLSGVFRLGAIATLGPYLIPHLLAPLRRTFPKLQLLLREGLTEGLLAKLRAGEVDAVLAARTFDETGLRVFPLFREPFLLTVPTEHPLAKQKSVSAKDLRASEMVLLEDGPCLKDQALSFCAPSRRGHPRELQATGLETLRHLVATGHGYTLIPALAALPDPRLKGLLRYRDFGREDVGRDIVLVTRESFPRMRDAETLAAFTRSHVPTGVRALRAQDL